MTRDTAKRHARRQKAWSLRTHFLVLVVPLLIAVTVAVFGYSEILLHRGAIERLRAKLDDMVAIESSVLSESLWNVADEQIQLILAALAIDPDFLGAVVYDEAGKQVAAVGETDEIANAQYRAASDILYEYRGTPERIGQLVLAFTDERIRAELRARLAVSIGLAVVLLLSVVGVTLIGNRRTVGIPLERLLAAIKVAHESGRRETVDWHSRDEIGEVVRAFNDMQARQEQYDNELRRARDDLERRVEERTRELDQKRRDMEQLSNQLAKFLPPQVYDSVFAGPGDVRVASSRKKLTIFFSDIAGFTETADRLASEALTELVNHYLTEMSDIAMRYGATIDKYMGDGIMIFFGDPQTRGEKEDAIACVRMAIEMRERMHSLADEWRESGLERPLTVRMGIHTGHCTVGNFGSEDRMDYTIIGGAANIASRLESMATPGEILISYETYALVRRDILCREKGRIEVKGLSYPLTTYVAIDAFESLARKRQHYVEKHPSFQIDLDIEAMDENDKNEARRCLEDAITVLSGEVDDDDATAPLIDRGSGRS